jgi:drug/metabolite transporter (DMT)-like permease
MSWQLLIGLSVILSSGNGLLHRTIMKDESSDAYAQAVAFTGLSALFFLIVLLVRGGWQTALSGNQLLLILASSVIQAVGMVFTFKGFKSIGASEHTILLTSCQLWKMPGAILFLQENLTLTKLAGTIVILGGIILAEWKKQAFKLNQGAVYVLLAAFCFAASGTAFYFQVRSLDVLSYLLYVCISINLILILFKPKIVRKLTFYFKPKRALNIMTTSINEGLASILGFTAYQIGRNALQISPIGATQTILTVLLAVVILKERDHLWQKIIGSLAAAMGAILLLK